MLPSSHAVPIMTLGVDPVPSPQLLADAFSEFISASSVLEASYRDLQQEVAHLGSELSQRNAALTRSLEENDRMRAALQQMLDSMPCGVLVLDQAERIVMINPEGRRLLELGSAHIDSLRELSRSSQVDFERLAKGPVGPFDSEVCIEAESGKRWLAISHRVLANVAAIDGSTGQANRLQSIWILRDITANKQAEQERETARRATALAEISTILAHEIKNPLASMELFAGLIEQERGEATAMDFAPSRRHSHAVRNGEQRAEPERRRQAAAGADSSFGLRRRAAWNLCGRSRSRPAWRFRFGQRMTSAQVLGNEDAIRQMVLNIVCNAIRHTAARRQRERFDAGGKARQGRRAELWRLRTQAAAFPRT